MWYKAPCCAEHKAPYSGFKPFADRVVIDRLEEAVDALGPAGPGHVLGWRKAGLVSVDGVAPDLGGLSKSKK